MHCVREDSRPVRARRAHDSGEEFRGSLTKDRDGEYGPRVVQAGAGAASLP